MCGFRNKEFWKESQHGCSLQRRPGEVTKPWTLSWQDLLRYGEPVAAVLANQQCWGGGEGWVFLGFFFFPKGVWIKPDLKMKRSVSNVEN